MSEVRNIPRLRFLDFEVDCINHYKKYIFSDLFVFSIGKNIKQSEASPEFNIPCVRYGELYHLYNEVIFKVVNRTNIDESELVFSEGNEILLPSAGEDPLDIGSASALTIPKIAIGRTINILKPKEKGVYNPIYVSYYINQQLKLRISKLAKGVSISNVYNSDLKKLNIKLPPLPEQQKIADFLTAVDKRIELLEKKKTLLETYKKGVMKQIFNQEIRFKDDNGNDFPDWEERKLKDLISDIIDNRGKTPPVSSEGIPLIEVNAIGKKNIDYSKIKKYVDQKTYHSWFRKHLIDNDILFSTVGQTAICSLYKEITKSCIAQNIVGLRFKNVDQKFMYYLLTEATNNHQFKRIEMGAVQPSVKVSQMIHLKFSLPNVNEQVKISHFISSIDIQIEISETQIEKSKTWKKGLLQKMFV